MAKIVTIWGVFCNVAAGLDVGQADDYRFSDPDLAFYVVDVLGVVDSACIEVDS